MYKGRFRIKFPGDPEIVVPNNLVDQGEESFLKMIFRADVTDVSAGGNFFLGFCNNSPSDGLVLASLTEPSGNGYARQPLSRDATGFPTLTQAGSEFFMRSKTASFSASGGDWSTAISRAFLCNVLSGSVGILFALSAPFSAVKSILDTESIDVEYEGFLY